MQQTKVGKSKIMLGIVLIIAAIVLSLFIFSDAFVQWVIAGNKNGYCMDTPIEELDKERCGL